MRIERAACLLLTGSIAFGDGSAQMLELDSPAPPGSGEPGLVLGADGGSYLSWIEDGEDEARFRFSRLTDREWSEPREIARGSNWFVNWADVPALAVLADGTLLAHWLEKTTADTYAYAIRFSLSHDGGETWSPPARLHDDPHDAEHGFVSWAVVDGAFGASWLNGAPIGGDQAVEGGHGATAIHFRTVSRAGERSPETKLDARVCDCCPTALACTADGRPWVVYRDRDANEVRDIGFVRRADDGWSAPATVHDDGWKIAGCPVNGPALATRGAEVACAWYTGADGGGVRLARLEGERFGAPVRVDDGAAEGRAQLAFLATGELAVLWLEHDAGDAQWRLRLVPTEGKPPESEVLADVASGRTSGFARIAPHGDGLVFAWTDTGGAARVRRVRTALVDPDGN